MGTRTGAKGLAPGGGKRWALALSLLTAVASLLLSAAPSNAAFHLMKVREVYPGASNDSYVVLQMLFTNENALGNHSLRLYNASGGTLDTFTFSPGYIAFSASHGNNTILIGDTSVLTTFGVAPDDHTDANLNIPAAGGAVCWLDGTPPDCVSWGNFSGSLPNPAGSPASPGGVTAGKALHRRIDASGCATYLEGSDDTDVSANDFSEQNPNPRNNASMPGEVVCPSLPNTTISGSKPADPTKNTTASFSFAANPSAGASFECKLDAEPGFTPCTSPKAYSNLSEASHTFEVRAVNSAGTDPTPASHKWRVDLTPPTATILTKPADPSPGKSTSFTYSSNEVGSKFECRLTPAEAGFTACNTQPKGYSNLSNGEYEFEVRTIDAAGNTQATPTSYPWTVDNSLADETPPQTAIKSAPPDPSGSSTAAFAYSSSEAGSSFECKLDGAAFASCGSAGITYTGLANGSHSFQVRARDSSGNVDASPAGYSWAVSASATIKPPALAPPPQTIITRKPSAVTKDRTPTFRFRSSVARSTFQCKLDRGAYKRCTSPFTTKKLTFGAHVVQVRALAAGSVDSSPAKSRFKVTKPKRKRRR